MNTFAYFAAGRRARALASSADIEVAFAARGLGHPSQVRAVSWRAFVAGWNDQCHRQWRVYGRRFPLLCPDYIKPWGLIG